MKRSLNIGCGRKPIPSDALSVWINLDHRAGPGVDVVRDLRRGLPFSDGSFQHVLCDNVLEHFDQDDAIFLLNEIDRVLTVEGTTLIIVPHADSQGAKQDPTHKSFWVQRSVLYWNQFTTSYGGTAVGITANLGAEMVEITDGVGKPIDIRGQPEFFIRYHCVKRAADYAPKVTP